MFRNFVRHSLFDRFERLATVSVSGQDWKKIGSKTIDLKNASDSIVIGKKTRTYAKFKLKVSGASVRISRVVFTFNSGERQTFKTPFTTIDGKLTNEGVFGNRIVEIERVDIWYESRSFNTQKAKLAVYAMTPE